MMILAYAGTGIFLSDGATNVMPVAPHRAAPGAALSASVSACFAASRSATWATFSHTSRLTATKKPSAGRTT